MSSSLANGAGAGGAAVEGTQAGTGDGAGAGAGADTGDGTGEGTRAGTRDGVRAGSAAGAGDRIGSREEPCPGLPGLDCSRCISDSDLALASCMSASCWESSSPEASRESCGVLSWSCVLALFLPSLLLITPGGRMRVC